MGGNRVMVLLCVGFVIVSLVFAAQWLISFTLELNAPKGRIPWAKRYYLWVVILAIGSAIAFNEKTTIDQLAEYNIPLLDHEVHTYLRMALLFIMCFLTLTYRGGASKRFYHQPIFIETGWVVVILTSILITPLIVVYLYFSPLI